MNETKISRGINQLYKKRENRLFLGEEACLFFTTMSVPKLKKENSDGKAKKLTMAMPVVIKTVENLEIRSCLLKDGSLSLTRLIS